MQKKRHEFIKHQVGDPVVYCLMYIYLYRIFLSAKHKFSKVLLFFFFKNCLCRSVLTTVVTICEPLMTDLGYLLEMQQGNLVHPNVRVHDIFFLGGTSEDLQQ
ncbi:hypothetical protein FCM35_KLT14103 [Carex littledalei]|uniref:Uncharacterized protein n=1 Tax=Carex littledalei TaxID=544730 RepID=A0A833QN66_9POAL|nr:hypothetical protein FCM35_KLT14103 [Carex littledalei]